MAISSDSTTPTPGPFDPYQLGPIKLRNRIVKAATFEEGHAQGAVSDELIAFHRPRGRRWRRIVHGGLLRSVDGRTGQPPLPGDEAGTHRRPGASHQRRPRRGRRSLRPVGPRRSLVAAPAPTAPTLAPSTRLSAPGMLLVKGPARLSWTSGGRALPPPPAWLSAGFDVLGDTPGPQLPALLVPQPQPQQAKGPLRRQPEDRLRFPAASSMPYVVRSTTRWPSSPSLTWP